ncbi:hypothetical protein DV096_04495 [Bradymonadaceae bacterium TMQ3]|nr:hypothetical protein DV096_04495 [Bradymonadaceae bacterium TMQ3]TXC77427.1 N-acetyltransferase [Bradymonadales bacterium TMQ1]
MDLIFSSQQSPATLTDAESGKVVSRIDYREDDTGFFLDYLWTDPACRGQGYARRMIDHFAAYVAAQGKRITPICGVARSMMQGDARYAALLHVGLRPR